MDDTLREAAARTVVARASQAYDLNLNVNFLPAREIPSVLRLGCHPRQGAQRVEVEPVDLPEPTRRFLLDASAVVTEWLARDANHRGEFLADPASALAKAGVKLDRTHAKAISRLRESIAAAETVTPGLQIRSVTTTANPKGRVKAPIPDPKWSSEAANSASDCGCDKKGGK